jgi:hypothetical protein
VARPLKTLGRAVGVLDDRQPEVDDVDDGLFASLGLDKAGVERFLIEALRSRGA